MIAPSNAAVDELVRSIANRSLQLTSAGFNQKFFNFVRIGNLKDAESNDVYEHTVDAQIERNLKQKEDQPGPSGMVVAPKGMIWA